MEKDLQDRFITLIRGYLAGNPGGGKRGKKKKGNRDKDGTVALADLPQEEIEALQSQALKVLEDDLAALGTAAKSECGLDPMFELIKAYGRAFKDEIEARRQEQQLKIYAEKLESSNRALEETSVRLEAVNQELEQFASIVSHDLKAPLRAIENLSEWIEEDLGDLLQGEARQNMDLLRKRVARMKNMVDGILQYSRATRSGIEPENVDCKELLVDVIDLLDPPPSFKVSVNLPMPELETAKTPLQQVFTNLIGNAIKHHHKKSGNVEIHSKDKGDHYEFTVKDDGPGISPDHHDHVFERFKTLKSRDEKEGTGLGLALVKKIVESAGGEIRLESEEGKGSKFIFSWSKKWK